MEKAALLSPEDPCKDDQSFQKFLQTLPSEKVQGCGDPYLYQGFWCPSLCIKPVISCQQHFQALDSDVVLVSFPKSGTTWLKALSFSILNRTSETPKDSSLLTANPQTLVPSLETGLYLESESPDFSDLPCPRIFSTHFPYLSLPHSIKDSSCRIVYVCRNPVDQLISLWHFINKFRASKTLEPFPLDEQYDNYCRGVHAFGPFADHVLGYWKASLDRPEKVLFLKYEDMKEDIYSEAKKLANFLGCPFSEEEEKQGVVGEICGLCSIESLKNLEVNKTGTLTSGIPGAIFFREAKVRGWEGLLSPAKAEYLENLIEEKLRGSGLTLKVSARGRKDECKPSPEKEA